MSNLYFPKVYRYEVYENLLFISWYEYSQCVDFITGELLFKLDHPFNFFKVIDNKLFGQKENGGDILVYDLKGNLLRTIDGQFYLWKVKQDDQFLYMSGKDESDNLVGFRIDRATLSKIDKIENYSNPLFVKNDLGILWWSGNVSGYNIFTGETLWTYDLGTGNLPEPRFNYLHNETLILTINDGRLISLDINRGASLWQKKPALAYYGMHPGNKNLYGLGNSFLFKVLDGKTGDLIVNKPFPELNEQLTYGFHSFLTDVLEDGLYFINLTEEKKFGKINIPGNTIEFVATIDIPGPTLKP
jgi:outer membrane protein assembly factor BamB